MKLIKAGLGVKGGEEDVARIPETGAGAETTPECGRLAEFGEDGPGAPKAPVPSEAAGARDLKGRGLEYGSGARPRGALKLG